MKHHDAKYALVFLSLASLASNASAGELGSSSRGTVSISITVPPHVMVTAASYSQQNGTPTTGGLCIASNGVHDFGLVILGPDPADKPRITPIEGRSSCGIDASFEISRERLAEEVADVPRHPAEPLTLLVVPN